MNIPRWVHELRDDLRADLAHVDHQARHTAARCEALKAELAVARGDLVSAERRLDPHRPALEAAAVAVDKAKLRLWSAEHSHDKHSWGPRHWRALHKRNEAASELKEARRHQDDLQALTQPEQRAMCAAADKVRELERTIRAEGVFDRWNNFTDWARDLRELLERDRRLDELGEGPVAAARPNPDHDRHP